MRRYVAFLRGVSPMNARMADLKRCFHAIYCGAGDLRQRAAAALADCSIGTEAPGRAFLEFFAGGKRGFARERLRRGLMGSDAAAEIV